MGLYTPDRHITLVNKVWTWGHNAWLRPLCVLSRPLSCFESLCITAYMRMTLTWPLPYWRSAESSPVAPARENLLLGADDHGAVHPAEHVLGLEVGRHTHLLWGIVGVLVAQPQATYSRECHTESHGAKGGYGENNIWLWPVPLNCVTSDVECHMPKADMMQPKQWL